LGWEAFRKLFSGRGGGGGGAWFFWKCLKKNLGEGGGDKNRRGDGEFLGPWGPPKEERVPDRGRPGGGGQGNPIPGGDFCC